MPDQVMTSHDPSERLQERSGSLLDWFDQRMGLRQMLHKLLDEPIPDGARFAYVFGSALLAVFLLQIASGIALMLYYVPSVDHAHTSVAYIMKVVTAGSFIRGLHVYGASAMVILVVLHLAQTFLYGSYKGRRELQWISGCILLALVFAMGFTGYLLPWDQKAYFATRVGANVPSEIPVLGGAIRRLMLGGATLGALTVSRFFVLHVIVIPGLLVLFIVLHLLFLRKRGAAGPVSEDPLEPRMKAAPFYPGQLTRDLFFAILVIVVIGIFAHFIPADLGPKANPADTQYLPRPDWYFRFLFQWLKYWPGKTVVIGLGLIPLIVTFLLIGLPFLDRRSERRPWRRPVSVGLFAVILAGVIALTALSYSDDDHNPAVAAQMVRQRQETAAFMRAPFEPDVVGGSPTGANNPLVAQGAQLFQDHKCFFCHGQGGVGSAFAPRLVGISQKFTPGQLDYLLHHPTPKMQKVGMTKVLNFKDDEWKAIIAYLESLK